MSKRSRHKHRRPDQPGGASPPAPAASAMLPAWSSWRALFAGYGAHMGVVFVALVTVYAATMPRVVTYEDEAIFNLVCHHGQPAHPPGYPLYSILCYPFANLPFVPAPLAGNLLSALFGAAACAVLFVIAVRLTGPADRPGSCRTLGGYLAGLGYGLSNLFWSQSIIQEVYTLHALLFLLMFLLALACATRFDPAHVKWLAVVGGLGMANHWVLTVLSAPALLVLLWPARREIVRHLGNVKNFAALFGLFALPAAAPYVYLLTTNLPSPVNFYGPLAGFDTILHYITRAGYAETDSQAVSWFEKALYLRFVLKQTVIQYGPVWLPFMVAGCVWQWRRWRWSVCWAVVIVYVSATYLLVGLVHFKYDELWTGVFSIYPLVAYCALALWGALGFVWVTEWIHRWIGERWVRATPAAAETPEATASATPVVAPVAPEAPTTPAAPAASSAVTATLAGLLLVSVAASNVAVNNRADDRLAYNFAKTLLDSFEPNADVLLATDFQLPMMELNLLEGVREDVTLYNVSGLFLSNRYLPALRNRKRQDQAAADFIRRTERPVYYFRELKHDYGVEDYCLYKKVRKDWPAGKKTARLVPGILDLWQEAALTGRDLHFDAMAKRILRRCLVGMIMEAEDLAPDARATWQARITGGGYADLISLIRFVALYHKQPPPGVTLKQLIDRAESSHGRGRAAAKDRAVLLYAKYYEAVGRMTPSQWRDPEAMRDGVAVLKESLAIYPSRENPSAEALIKVAHLLNDDAQLAQLHERYPSLKKKHDRAK